MRHAHLEITGRWTEPNTRIPGRTGNLDQAKSIHPSLFETSPRSIPEIEATYAKSLIEPTYVIFRRFELSRDRCWLVTKPSTTTILRILSWLFTVRSWYSPVLPYYLGLRTKLQDIATPGKVCVPCGPWTWLDPTGPFFPRFFWFVSICLFTAL